MIGDRIFDIEAAHANHIRCLAVGWGYGPEEETLFGGRRSRHSSRRPRSPLFQRSSQTLEVK
jgi:hypothetical protein